MAYYFYRLAGFVCPLIPARVGYWLFARFGDLLFRFTAQRQQTYFRNLRRVLGDDATPAQLNEVARRAFQNLLKNYFDLFRWHNVSKAKLRTQLAGLNGFEFMENAVKQGKGVIAGSGHFGAWDLVINLSAIYLETEIIVPNERLKPEKLFQYVIGLRSQQGIHIVPLDEAPRLMIKALRAGKIVGLAYDRDITRTGPVVDFFGAPAQMPDGAVQLSLKYGYPVIIGFSVRQPDNRSVVYIEPPFEFENTGNAHHDIQVGVQKIASVLEKYIRQYPDQWLMFQPIWS
jgi:KDO2-lipid IV(A) lauroyltransferase